MLAVLAVALLGCAPLSPGDAEARLALEDLAAAHGPSRLKSLTATPTRRPIAYTVAGRWYDGDVYLPEEGSLAGIVLVPGVVPEGKDDNRLVALAYTLARLRFAVLVPDLKGVRKLQVRAGDVDEVADAFRYLIARPDLAPRGQAGIAGFSYGAGPVLLAALRPDLRDRVRFVVALGGYYDLRSIVTYFTTGYYREPGSQVWRYRQPASYIKWVFARSNAELLEQPADRAVLRDLAGGVAGALDEAAVSTDLAPDAAALVALLRNRIPERVPALVEALSPRIRRELEGLTPAGHDLASLRARVILVHGRADTMVPYTESLALARALPPRRTELFLIDGFAHVEIELRHRDVPQLQRAMRALLAQRIEADTPR